MTRRQTLEALAAEFDKDAAIAQNAASMACLTYGPDSKSMIEYEARASAYRNAAQTARDWIKK
jgi:hypothetical protein